MHTPRQALSVAASALEHAWQMHASLVLQTLGLALCAWHGLPNGLADDSSSLRVGPRACMNTPPVRANERGQTPFRPGEQVRTHPGDVRAEALVPELRLATSAIPRR